MASDLKLVIKPNQKNEITFNCTICYKKITFNPEYPIVVNNFSYRMCDMCLLQLKNEDNNAINILLTTIRELTKEIKELNNTIDDHERCINDLNDRLKQLEPQFIPIEE